MSIQLQLLSIDLRGSELGHDIKFKGSMKDRGASVNGQAVSTFPPNNFTNWALNVLRGYKLGFPSLN